MSDGIIRLWGQQLCILYHRSEGGFLIPDLQYVRCLPPPTSRVPPSPLFTFTRVLWSRTLSV